MIGGLDDYLFARVAEREDTATPSSQEDSVARNVTTCLLGSKYESLI